MNSMRKSQINFTLGLVKARLYSQLTTFIMANNNDLTTRSKHK